MAPWSKGKAGGWGSGWGVGGCLTPISDLPPLQIYYSSDQITERHGNVTKTFG